MMKTKLQRFLIKWAAILLDDQEFVVDQGDELICKECRIRHTAMMGLYKQNMQLKKELEKCVE